MSKKLLVFPAAVAAAALFSGCTTASAPSVSGVCLTGAGDRTGQALVSLSATGGVKVSSVTVRFWGTPGVSNDTTVTEHVGRTLYGGQDLPVTDLWFTDPHMAGGYLPDGCTVVSVSTS